MKGVHFIKDETDDKRYVQIELSTLKKIRQRGKSISDFLEDIEDLVDYELAKDLEGRPWGEVKRDLQNQGVLSKDVRTNRS